MHSKNGKKKNMGVQSAKECAFLAVFVALVIAAQFCFAAIPGVELVTILFLSYSYVMGAKRGMIAATAFSLLRQMLFGFFVEVLVLYLLYFNAFALLFGLLGKKWTDEKRALPYLVLVVCICTACFTILDNLINLLWYGMTKQVFKIYFLAALPVMCSQIVCAALTTFFLFLPLQKVFAQAKRSLI